MAAITDKFSKVGTGTITSLQAPGKAVAAANINIGSSTNYPTDTAVYFAMRRVDPTTVTSTNLSGIVAGTYTVWKGTVSGTVISNLTLQYGSDQVYPAGTNTQVFIDVTSAQMNQLIDGILAQHTQLGAHTGVTTDTLAASSNVTVGGTLNVTGNFTTAGTTPSFAANSLLSGFLGLAAGKTGGVASQTNAGTAGGTMKYINLGGIKLLWCIGTSPYSIASGIGNKSTLTFTLPTFFTTIDYVSNGITNLTGDGRQAPSDYAVTGVTSISASAENLVASAVGGCVSIFVIGT